MNSIGDIQSVTADGTTTNRTTNADNQIIHIGSATVSYDNNGKVTTDDKGNTLVYDAWNRLVEVKNSSGDLVAGYTYDGLGRMTSETDGITTIDFYYSGQQIIEERTGVTNATGGSTGSNGSVTEELVYAPDYVNDVLSRDTYASGSYSSRVFFTHDANYDVTGVVQNSTSGTMLQHMTYDSYGNVTFLTSSWTTTTDGYGVENLWQGGWRDVMTGYYRFQRRWYSPSMQWLSWDPKNYIDGLSAYTPEGGDPAGRLDPTGSNWGGAFVGWVWGGLSKGVSLVDSGVRAAAADIDMAALSAGRLLSSSLHTLEIGIDNVIANWVEGPAGSLFLAAMPKGTGGIAGKSYGVSGSGGVVGGLMGGLQIEAVVLKDACKVCFYLVPNFGPNLTTPGGNFTGNKGQILGVNVRTPEDYGGLFVGVATSEGAGLGGYLGAQQTLAWAPDSRPPGVAGPLGLLPSSARPLVVNVAVQAGIGSPGVSGGVFLSYGYLLKCLPLK